MRNNTRFAPTPTGKLHVGHLFLCLLNRDVARRNGGKFLVRMETEWAAESRLYGTTVGIKDLADGILRDMEWAGVPPDYVSWQDETRWIERVVIERYDHLAIPTEITCSKWKFNGGRGDMNLLHHTPGKVVYDHVFGCDPVIRGEDLMIEHHWYLYLCGLFGFDPPEMWYVPRLKLDQQVVSKTGVVQLPVEMLRQQGWTPEGLSDLIRRACLLDPDKGFDFPNIKRQPTLTEEDLSEPR